MESASVTVSDIIDVLNLSSARRTKETNSQVPVQPSTIDAILVERANNDNDVLINPQSLGTIPDEEQKTGRHNSQRLCHRLCYHQSKDISTENPVSFLSQKRFYVASLGRSVTLDDFGKRSSDFEGKSLEKQKSSWRTPLDECQNRSDDSSYESSSRNSFDASSPFFRRWKSFVNDMGTIISTQGEYSSHDWDPDEKTSAAEDLDDPLDWLRRPPIRNRFNTGSRGTREDGDTLRPSGAARSSDLDRVAARSGNGVPSAIRRPGKYFLGNEEDDLPRRERINFKLLAAQLFRPKRSIVAVAPKTTYDPTIYAFQSPLSEELGCLDLVALSREGRDWRTVTDARPKDLTEEKILDRLIHMKRLEDETVEMENAERASRGSQCRNGEQPSRRTKSSVGSGGKDCGSIGGTEVRLARGLGTQVCRLSMERSGLEKSTRLRKTESRDDPNGKEPQKRWTSKKKPQLERHEGPSEQSRPQLILTAIQPDCEKLVQVKGHQLTSDDPDDKKNTREGSSNLKLKAGHRKLDNVRSTCMVVSGKLHPSLRSVSFADPPKMPRSTKKSSSAAAAAAAAATKQPSSSKKRRRSSKKRPQTAV